MKLYQKDIFALNATLKTSYGNAIKINQFDRIYCIKKIKEVPKSDTYYDSELKMHFQTDDLRENVYELNLYKNYLKLEKDLQKSQEFIRRISFLNDWMQVRINQRGKIISIDNKSELINNWKKIKNILLNEYEGKIAFNYLKTIDKRLTEENSLFPTLFQYNFFALLFPHIPIQHASKWDKIRNIELSEYEKERFEERITYIKTENDLRQYSITGNALKDNTFEVEFWKGDYFIESNELFPKAATVDIVIKNDDYKNYWSFKLNKY